jgi:glycosyltransferase involved in cell wall biosynthesis
LVRILFVTWDGPQVNYLESLFLPIFIGLRPYGYHFDVLQFRWGDQASTEKVRRACEGAGIGYRSVTIWRRMGGIGPLLSALVGRRSVRQAVSDFGSDLVMPRSLMAAIPVLAAGGAKFRPLLFDADGLAADERVEFAGLSSSGATYKILRAVERRMVRSSRSILVRSPKGAEILRERAGAAIPLSAFHSVANGRDEHVFHPFDEPRRRAVRLELGIAADAPLLVYAGSVGGQYRLDLVRALAREVARLRPDMRLLVLSGSPDLASAELAGDLMPPPIVMRAAPAEVPRYLAAADIGLAFRANSFSMQAVAPVKISEYLLCGVPVIGTAAVGDNRAATEAGVFFDEEQAGVAAAAEWAVKRVLPERERFREAARRVGVEFFSLRRSVADYAAALAAGSKDA